jgi:hypothetical protein
MTLEATDLDRILKRHAAFWNREIVDRLCIAVTAPVEDPVEIPQAADDQQFLCDSEFMVRWYLAQNANTYRAGDALSRASAHGNLLYPAWGGNGKFASRTVWVDPSVNDWTAWREYRFDANNIWLRRYLDSNRALAQAAPDNFFVETQGFFGAMDAMASMRGYEGFLIELQMGEARETIRSAQARAIAGHVQIVREAWDAVERYQRGTVMAPGIWAPGRINYWSADFSALIGPRDFERWLVQEFATMVSACPFSLYHLDGPNAVRHLPAIAAIPGLRGIQFTPAPFQSADDIIPIVRRIQSHGMATWVSAAYADVERFARELDPHGLFIFARAPDPQAADELVRQAQKWSRATR